MDNVLFDTEVEKTLEVLRSGGVVLYPTDTVWGLGCDATNERAIERICAIKKRVAEKSFIILVADERSVLQYVAAPNPQVFPFLEQQAHPTTVIFESAIGLPDNLVADDGSIAIRIVRDEFCRHLIKRLRKPLVSTSANISGEPTPQTFAQINDAVKKEVDYIVQWRQDDKTPVTPSQIIKWHNDGHYEIIRRPLPSSPAGGGV